MRKYLAYILVLLPILYTVDAFAATVNVADYGDGTPTKANFELAYAAASANDTIVFPLNGAATWTEGTTIGKALTINGNGTTLTTTSTMTNGFFRITGFTTTDLVRITGFDFEMTNWTPVCAVKVDTMVADKIRIDHNTFAQGYYAIQFLNPVGLIDNNTFYNSSMTISYSAGSDANADASWASLTAGAADALFIEDNHFIDNESVSGNPQERIGTYNGGKLTVRYNHWDSTAMTSYKGEPFQSHGNAINPGYYGNAGYRRSQSVIEIYENDIDLYNVDFVFIVRGGSALIYNNTITTLSGTGYFKLWEEEWTDAAQFTPQRQAWPSEDQIHNSFLWNNTINGPATTLIISPRNSECTADDTPYLCCSGNGTGNCNTAIVQDQDFFLHAPLAAGAGTDGAESFTSRAGASGSTPTNGDPYANTGTMVFTADVNNAYYPYTAYAYPHDLQNAGETLYTVTPSVSGTGGTLSPIVPASVVSGEDSPTYTQTPSNGYRGTWSGTCGATGTGSTYQKTNVTADCTVVVTFDTIKIGAILGPGVTYDGNGSDSGTVPATLHYRVGGTVTVSANTGTLARTGYTFSKWNTAADGSGTDYDPADTFTINGNVTLYAQWEETFVAATGGTVTTDGDYKIHKFTTSGTFTVSTGGYVEAVVVAGGGGGGGCGTNMRGAGGGGGGGVNHDEAYVVNPGEITVTIGGGGTGGAITPTNGSKGENSVFGTLTAIGGGGGAKGAAGTTTVGSDGGSGGGGSASSGAGGNTEDSDQGNNGGAGGPASGNYTAGGGGGAGAAGVAGQSTVAGDGGAGVEFIAKFGTGVGASGYFAGGGGGGTWDGGTSGWGVNGGGNGRPSVGNGVSGTANTGGGGGGAGTNAAGGGSGGNGGSGIVLIRYKYQ